MQFGDPPGPFTRTALSLHPQWGFGRTAEAGRTERGFWGPPLPLGLSRVPKYRERGLAVMALPSLAASATAPSTDGQAISSPPAAKHKKDGRRTSSEGGPSTEQHPAAPTKPLRRGLDEQRLTISEPQLLQLLQLHWLAEPVYRFRHTARAILMVRWGADLAT